mmetsp:Transcript_38659/g.74124  ORF Transcript_38659/g.74124 Transcript_38659/m.74124 type:complete len:702 (-) Transcript_38659:107-2212(-)
MQHLQLEHTLSILHGAVELHDDHVELAPALGQESVDVLLKPVPHANRGGRRRVHHRTVYRLSQRAPQAEAHVPRLRRVLSPCGAGNQLLPPVLTHAIPLGPCILVVSGSGDAERAPQHRVSQQSKPHLRRLRRTGGPAQLSRGAMVFELLQLQLQFLALHRLCLDLVLQLLHLVLGLGQLQGGARDVSGVVQVLDASRVQDLRFGSLRARLRVFRFGRLLLQLQPHLLLFLYNVLRRLARRLRHRLLAALLHLLGPQLRSPDLSARLILQRLGVQVQSSLLGLELEHHVLVNGILLLHQSLLERLDLLLQGVDLRGGVVVQGHLQLHLGSQGLVLGPQPLQLFFGLSLIHQRLLLGLLQHLLNRRRLRRALLPHALGVRAHLIRVPLHVVAQLVQLALPFRQLDLLPLTCLRLRLQGGGALRELRLRLLQLLLQLLRLLAGALHHGVVLRAQRLRAHAQRLRVRLEGSGGLLQLGRHPVQLLRQLGAVRLRRLARLHLRRVLGEGVGERLNRVLQVRVLLAQRLLQLRDGALGAVHKRLRLILQSLGGGLLQQGELHLRGRRALRLRHLERRLLVNGRHLVLHRRQLRVESHSRLHGVDPEPVHVVLAHLPLSQQALQSHVQLVGVVVVAAHAPPSQVRGRFKEVLQQLTTLLQVLDALLVGLPKVQGAVLKPHCHIRYFVVAQVDKAARFKGPRPRRNPP